MKPPTHSKSVSIALLSNLFVTIIKFIGYFLSMSPSMLSEAIHSAADTGNQAFLWIGERSSSLESSKTHPWGKGEVQFLFNFMSAIGIFVLGCVFSVYHSFQALINTSPIASHSIFIISVIILIVSFLV